MNARWAMTCFLVAAFLLVVRELQRSLQDALAADDDLGFPQMTTLVCDLCGFETGNGAELEQHRIQCARDEYEELQRIVVKQVGGEPLTERELRLLQKHYNLAVEQHREHMDSIEHGIMDAQMQAGETPRRIRWAGGPLPRRVSWEEIARWNEMTQQQRDRAGRTAPDIGPAWVTSAWTPPPGPEWTGITEAENARARALIESALETTE